MSRDLHFWRYKPDNFVVYQNFEIYNCLNNKSKKLDLIFREHDKNELYWIDKIAITKLN